ncbi:MAG TPA: hypothetical protein VGW40_06560 [Allosphingosinicella sp.]|nr:hypothetical protein [Allosphingosinicella sp.]
MKKLAVLTFALISSTVPAVAETTSTQLDPNEVICRTERATGSRLGVSRRCATRAQWLEDERMQRAQMAERQIRQTNPACFTPGERGGAMGRYVAAPARGNCQ